MDRPARRFNGLVGSYVSLPRTHGRALAGRVKLMFVVASFLSKEERIDRCRASLVEKNAHVSDGCGC